MGRVGGPLTASADRVVVRTGDGRAGAAIAKNALPSEDRAREVIHNLNADRFDSLGLEARRSAATEVHAPQSWLARMIRPVIFCMDELGRPNFNPIRAAVGTGR